jgi:hypothetical protein
MDGFEGFGLDAGGFWDEVHHLGEMGEVGDELVVALALCFEVIFDGAHEAVELDEAGLKI